MNTPNPLVPQGSLEKQSKGRSNVHIAILTIVSIHAVFFAGLLMQGCRRDDGKTALQSAEAATNENTLPPLDSEYYPPAQDMAQAASPAPAPAVAYQQPIQEASPPAPFPAPVEEPLRDGKIYRIVKGDTLAAIAKANGVTLSALTRANPDVQPSRLRPGSEIQIPAGTAALAPAPAPAQSATTAVAGGSIHRVKRGETLSRIARKHGVTVKAIRAANNLTSDRIRAGQKLTLPGRSATEPKLTAANGSRVSGGTYTR